VRLPAARRPCILLQNAPPVRACCPDKGTPVALLNCSLPLCGAGLKKFLKKHAEGDTLAVLDAKLGSLIKEKLGINCLYSSGVMELTRGIRNQLTSLVAGLSAQDLRPMSLGLSHSLSRYKLKFSPDKVDTMIVQAIGLLDDLDKELNTYAMRVREWYGWHFPEMTKIVTDNIAYAKTVKLMGTRDKAAGIDFSDVLEEEVESQLKEAGEARAGARLQAHVPGVQQRRCCIGLGMGRPGAPADHLCRARPL
jgi:nucleolar protein 58